MFHCFQLVICRDLQVHYSVQSSSTSVLSEMSFPSLSIHLHCLARLASHGEHLIRSLVEIFPNLILHHNLCLIPTTCKTRPTTRFCPAREMFLNYNTNRPAACHRPPLPMMYHSRLRCLPLHRLKPNVINNVNFVWI